MASISNGSWETDLRDSVCTNFGQGWLVLPVFNDEEVILRNKQLAEEVAAMG